MARAYWIAHVTVTDADAYKGYQAHAPEAFAKYGATFLARGGAAQTLEGDDGWQRHVVIEFADRATALACYRSAEYTAARKLRAGACVAHVVIVDGV